MRAMIYGAGALGTVLGAYIAKAGVEIDLVNRNKAHVAALREKGAHITGTVDFVQPVHALLPEEMTGKYDVILLMTKQSDNARVVTMLGRYLAEDGVICTCQNGLPEPAIAEIVGVQRTLGCAIAWGATFHGEGVSELTSDPSALTFSLGAIAQPVNHLEDVKQLLECMGTVVVEDNFMGARWSKLLINSAFSGLSTVTGGTFGEVSVQKPSRKVAQRIIKECIDVARAAKITIEPVQGHKIDKLFDYHGALKKAVSFAGFLSYSDIVLKYFPKRLQGMLRPAVRLALLLDGGRFGNPSAGKVVSSSLAKVLYIQGTEDEMVPPSCGIGRIDELGICQGRVRTVAVPSMGHQPYLAREAERHYMDCLKRGEGSLHEKEGGPMNLELATRLDPAVMKVSFDFLKE